MTHQLNQRRFVLKALVALTKLVMCVSLSGVSVSGAEAYPNKPIRIIIAQAPGSASDVFTRFFGHRLSERVGKPVVVDARPGAGGSLGTAIAAKATADGYTLLMANNSTHGANPALYSNLPYQAVHDFAPIALMSAAPYVLLVNPALGVQTTGELVALAKSKPGLINYASAGIGSTHHLSVELLKTMAGIDIVHVPYKGGPPAVNAVIAGEASLLFVNASGVVAQIKSGRVRALAITMNKRTGILPEVPTMAESGFPGFDISAWFGLVAPAGTPRSLVERLNAETGRVLTSPEVSSTLLAQGQEVMFGSPQRFAEFIKAEIAKFSKIVKIAGVKAE